MNSLKNEGIFMPLADAAKKLGCSREWIRLWTTGAAGPRLSSIQRGGRTCVDVDKARAHIEENCRRLPPGWLPVEAAAPEPAPQPAGESQGVAALFCCAALDGLRKLAADGLPVKLTDDGGGLRAVLVPPGSAEKLPPPVPVVKKYPPLPDGFSVSTDEGYARAFETTMEIIIREAECGGRRQIFTADGNAVAVLVGPADWQHIAAAMPPESPATTTPSKTVEGV